MTAELKADVVAAYLGGATCINVAERFGVGSRSVARWVRDAGHDLRPSGRPPGAVEQPEPSEKWRAEHAERLDAALAARGLGAEDVISILEAWRLYGTNRSSRKLSISELALQVGSQEPADLFTVGRTRYWLWDDVLAWLAPGLARRWDARCEQRRNDVIRRWKRTHARRSPSAGSSRWGYQGIARVHGSISTHRPWNASIGYQGKDWHLGNRATPEEAARLYDRALIALGERPVNFPLDIATTMLLPEPHIGPKTSVTSVLLQIIEKCGPVEGDALIDLLATWPVQPTRPTTRVKAQSVFHTSIVSRGRAVYVEGGWVLPDRADDYRASRPPGRHYDKATRERVLQAIRDGSSARSAARAHGVGEHTASEWARKAGVGGRQVHTRFTPEQHADAVAAYAAGESSTRIAARLGTGASDVLRWVRNAGVEVRPIGRRPAPGGGEGS